MDFTKYRIVNNDFAPSVALRNKILFKYPLFQVPKFDEYNQNIKDYCIRKNSTPYLVKFDINGDGIDELILIIKHRLLGGFGDLLIVNRDGSLNKIKWERPVNALFFDYSIEISKPKVYTKFGMNQGKDSKLDLKNDHLCTQGYLSRVLYWDSKSFEQLRVSPF